MTKGTKKGKPICEYDLSGQYIRTWRNAPAIAAIYPVSERTVWDATNGIINTMYGRQWRYLKDTNRSNIKPIQLSPYIQRKTDEKIASKEYFYDVSIPEELLYTYDKDNKEDIINELHTMIKDASFLSAYHKQLLEETIEYLENN